MMNRLRTGRVVSVALMSLLAIGAMGCGGKGKSGGKASSFKQEDGEENLKALLTFLYTSNSSGDVATAAGLTRGLIPTKETVAKAFRDDAPPDFAEKMLENVHKMVPKEDEKLAKLMAPPKERSEIHVWPATTEEIIEYKADSIAYKEFPGGAKKIAETMLRPGMKFYEVEFVEPGKDMGTKYHLFFWNGKSWTMLGPAWRSLDKEAP